MSPLFLKEPFYYLKVQIFLSVAYLNKTIKHLRIFFNTMKSDLIAEVPVYTQVIASFAKDYEASSNPLLLDVYRKIHRF